MAPIESVSVRVLSATNSSVMPDLPAPAGAGVPASTGQQAHRPPPMRNGGPRNKSGVANWRLFFTLEIDRNDVRAVLDRLGDGAVVLSIVVGLGRFGVLNLEAQLEIDRRIVKSGDRGIGDHQFRRHLVEAQPDREPLLI